MTKKLNIKTKQKTKKKNVNFGCTKVEIRLTNKEVSIKELFVLSICMTAICYNNPI